MLFQEDCGKGDNMKTLSEWLQNEGPVKMYLQELMQKYNIDEEVREVRAYDILKIMRGAGNVRVDPFTNKAAIQAGLFGIEIKDDNTAVLLTLNQQD